jgi:hypothetical protein
MNKSTLSFFLLFTPLFLVSQVNQRDEKKEKEAETIKARHDQYQIYTIERDTTFVDTSLTIQSEYKYNYLRKDTFGLLPFANEGQSYTVLDFGLIQNSPYPEMGFTSKHFNYYAAEEVKYYSVATPITELYFKTVMEQGQSVDALISVNTSEQFNFSIGYRGLRSLGKYINQLSSNGNFKFTASYFTKNKRYKANFHYTGQDLLNGENGGITTLSDFEGEDPAFRNRPRLQVFFTDAKSFLKGKRAFINHEYRINSKATDNNLIVHHQFNYETKYFEFNQATTSTRIDQVEFKRFGETLVGTSVNDQVDYDKMYNQVAVSFKNKLLGNVRVFAEDYFFKQFYGEERIVNNLVIPNKIQNRINSIGGQYFYSASKLKGSLLINQAITNQTFSQLIAQASYQVNEKNSIAFQLENISKLPDNNYILNQSNYINYNWFNSFKNEKINTFSVDAKTQWATASLRAMVINDHLFFSDDIPVNNIQIVTPKQYDKTINYLSVAVSKEFKYKKWALDNTLLYQSVTQDDPILNVPQVTTRNTIYYSSHFFKKAMFLQTGIIFNYFTKYYANDYNPLLAEAFVQNERKIGDFPMLDFFVNARIRQARIFLKAEHFNSSFTGNTFYSAPNYPYRDFMVRFGLVWNFYQ